MNQNYIVDKLTLSDLTTSGKIVIPSFQRGIVWSKEHRKDFIETVKTGDPFGVVLVSQEKPNDPYILIDGLQRLSTLKAYMTNPLEFIDENDKFIDEDKLNKIFDEKYIAKGLQVPKKEKLNREKKVFLKKLISILKGAAKIPDAVDIWPDICEVLEINEGEFKVLREFTKFYSSFLENMKLPDIIIHAIVYTGPKDRLPTVFEHLNTTSVTLSKYEVYSSQWPNIKIVMNDDDIVKNVWAKYSGLKDKSAFEIDTTEDIIRNEGITLFEYCFALSEILNYEKNDYSYMFSKTKKSTDPTGFDLLCLACGMPVNRADRICDDAYLGGTKDGSFYLDIKNALIESIKIVDSCLRNYVLDLKGTHIKNGNIYHFYHMIISVFNHSYELDLVNKRLNKKTDSTNASWIESFRKYAYKWYLLHRLSNFWNEHRQVSDLRNLLDDPTSDIYVTDIPQTRWEDILSKYFDKLKASASSRIIDNDTKLFLNYYYRLLIREDNNRNKFFIKQGIEDAIFDIEHIAPVDKFKKFSEDLPISAVGNLCYLPVKDNRSKRDKTIYEYAADRPSLTFNDEFLKLIDYPEEKRLRFVNFVFDDFKKEYEAMIERRESTMLQKFYELISKY